MRPGAKNKRSRYTSNKTHNSPTDPDAWISVKPGKARKLNYLCNLAVDIEAHVITDVRAYHADKKRYEILAGYDHKVEQTLAPGRPYLGECFGRCRL